LRESPSRSLRPISKSVSTLCGDGSEPGSTRRRQAGASRAPRATAQRGPWGCRQWRSGCSNGQSRGFGVPCTNPSFWSAPLLGAQPLWAQAGTRQAPCGTAVASRHQTAEPAALRLLELSAQPIVVCPPTPESPLSGFLTASLLRGCPGKPGAGNPHAGFYLGGTGTRATQARLYRPSDLSPSTCHQTPHVPILETDDYRLAQGGRHGGGGTLPHRNGCPARGRAFPLLMNVALHGLETAITTAFPVFKDGRRWQPRVIRFADALVVCHRDYHAIGQAQDIAARWRQEMGLALKPRKTRIGHALHPVDGTAGFDSSVSMCGNTRLDKRKPGKPDKATPWAVPPSSSPR
jgi:hypothetical protein